MGTPARYSWSLLGGKDPAPGIRALRDRERSLLARGKPLLTQGNDSLLPSSCRVTAASDLDLRGGTVLWLLASSICSACRGGAVRDGGRRRGCPFPFLRFPSQATDWPRGMEEHENLRSVIGASEAD